MKIKLYKSACLSFKTSDAKLVTNPDQAKLDLKKNNPDLVVLSANQEVETDGYYIVKHPGEYEVKDIFVYGFKSEVNGEVDDINSDIFLFDIEDIHTAFIDKSVKSVKKSILDELATANILVLPLSEDSPMPLEKKIELIKYIEPNILIPIDYSDIIMSELLKKTGYQVNEETEELIINNSDFLEEEVITRCIKLTSRQ